MDAKAPATPLKLCLAFGSFDGVTSVMGPIIAGSGISAHALMISMLGLGISSAIGMGAGEYLADNASGWREALAMGLASALGTIAPVIPFLIFRRHAVALGVSIALCLGYSVLVGRIRGRGWQHYAQSLGIILSVIGVVYSFTALFP